MLLLQWKQTDIIQCVFDFFAYKIQYLDIILCSKTFSDIFLVNKGMHCIYATDNITTFRP